MLTFNIYFANFPCMRNQLLGHIHLVTLLPTNSSLSCGLFGFSYTIDGDVDGVRYISPLSIS